MKHSLLAYFVVWLTLFLCRSVEFWSSSRYDIAFVFSIKKDERNQAHSYFTNSCFKSRVIFQDTAKTLLCWFFFSKAALATISGKLAPPEAKKKMKISPTQSPPACNLSNNLVTLFHVISRLNQK